MDTDRYQVVIRYCDNQEFEHDHSTLLDATVEYSRLLADAIEPTERLEARHIRTIDFIKFKEDRADGYDQWVSTGPFVCEHRPDSTEPPGTE